MNCLNFSNIDSVKHLHKYYRIKGSPSEIYAALTNPFSIALWTGYDAVMKEEPDTEFSLFEGDITGRNLAFERDHKIVQEWYFGEQEDQSIVTITLKPDRYFTRIELQHTNIPDEAYEDIQYGWDHYYFGGLKEFFEK